MSNLTGLCIPPRPPGDPAGMTALAHSLQAQAWTIADLGSHARSRYRSSEFQGPAATRVAGRVDQVATGATVLANRLSDFAATVARAAADLAAQQAEHDRLVARLEAQAAHA